MENISLLIKNFKNKSVLVTGGAGFIGSHLVKKLLSLKAKVTVIVKYNSIIDCVRLADVWEKLSIVEREFAPDVEQTHWIEKGGMKESIIKCMPESYLQEVKKGIHTSNIGFLTRYKAKKRLIALFTDEQISTLPVLNKINLNPEFESFLFTATIIK